MIHKNFYEKVIKRILDVLISSVTILLFSWLYAIIALLVRFFLGSLSSFLRNAPDGTTRKPAGKSRFAYISSAQ